ncbi:hypothetical protein DUNSADRAFT_2629 [Dunaliella salina]|uniref:Uncharacterized protein n=1 Tax=Dunaliella salina TaxID=3046 RepID=A0ABQ7GVC2_DUNSA|nr:hypothetical protein DUNSADRAFT_2629 [Dunaliella salina]|eukprot:KAF5838568.1 hypothetical protein DUNSADRAFT_2629 [Dunaliella salina]
MYACPQASVSPVPSEPPSWTLAIHGRILDASDPSGALVLAPGASPPVMQTLTLCACRCFAPSFTFSLEIIRCDSGLYPCKPLQAVYAFCTLEEAPFNALASVLA